MYYYQRIRDLREDKDLLQKQVCGVIECKTQQYQLYESGKREIPFHSAVKLADFYGVSLDYIAGRTKEKKGLNISELPPEETALIQKFRSLSRERRGRLLERLDILAEEEAEDTGKQ